MKQTINPVSALIRVLLILLLVLFNYEIFCFTCQTVSEAVSLDSQPSSMRQLQEHIAKDSYGDALDYLNLFDLYGEEYDSMQNAVEAYRLYCLYTAASRAAEESDSPEFTLQCQKQAEQALEDLRHIPDQAENATAQAAIQRIKEKLL